MRSGMAPKAAPTISNPDIAESEAIAGQRLDGWCRLEQRESGVLEASYLQYRIPTIRRTG